MLRQNAEIVEITHFDFSKSFDTIPHDILLSKLRKCQVSEQKVEKIFSKAASR